MVPSPALFLYTAAFLAGVYSHPQFPSYLYAMYVFGAIMLALSGKPVPARAALAASFLALGAAAGPGTGEDGSHEVLSGGVLLSGRVGVVTETGLFLETAGGRNWVSGRRCAGSCMEGDSLLVLGRADSGWVHSFSFRVRSATDPLTLARRYLAAKWLEMIPSAEASALVAALLVGERSRMPDRVRLVFRDSGTSHILSVSGFHVSMVAAAVFLALRGMAGKRSWVLAPAVLLLSGYVLLTGAKPPAVRSGFMAAAVLCGAAAGVRIEPLVLWSVAAALVLAVCPGAAGDAGAQMSFTAVLALVLLSRRIPGKLGGVATSLYAGTCVTAALAPLVAGTYGYFQVSSPYSTVISVPFMAALMVLGIAGFALIPVAGPARLVAAAWITALEKTTLPRVGFPEWAWPVWAGAVLALLLESKRRGFLKRFR